VKEESTTSADSAQLISPQNGLNPKRPVLTFGLICPVCLEETGAWLLLHPSRWHEKTYNSATNRQTSHCHPSCVPFHPKKQPLKDHRTADSRSILKSIHLDRTRALQFNYNLTTILLSSIRIFIPPREGIPKRTIGEVSPDLSLRSIHLDCMTNS